MKNLILLFLLSFVFIVNSDAQVAQTDSVWIKTKAANADAGHFKPTKAIRLAKRKRLLLNTSDYFLPVAEISNPQFLKDSVYVQAYKDAAYRKSVYGKIGHIHYTADLSAGHIVKIALAGTAAIILTVLFIRVILIGAAGK